MGSGKGIDDLPDELLLEIFSYFSTEELAMTVQHVSSRWKDVSQDNSLWENRAFIPDLTTSDDEIDQLLRNMPKLKKFSQPLRRTTECIIETLCNTNRNIQQLEFSSFQRLKLHTLKKIVHAFPDLMHFGLPLPLKEDFLKFFMLIGQFNKLTTLSFNRSYVSIKQKVLSLLADECLSLQHIDLSCCIFDDEDIRYFLEKKRYKILSFSVRCCISALTFLTLTECTNLEYLEYENRNVDLTDKHLNLFSKLTKMKHLTLYCVGITQTRHVAGMFAKNACPYSITLSISTCSHLEPQTLNAILRNCPYLKELRIYDCTIVGGGFESISICNKLEKLKLEVTRVRDKDFEYIGSGCHELKHLTVNNCGRITNKAFEYISAGCPLLEELNVNYVHTLTDDVFVHLFKCKNLRFLSFNNVGNITGILLDEILKHLVYLKTLHISWCKKFKRRKVEKLQAKLPQLKIIYEGENVIEESESDIDLEDVFLFN